MQFWRNAISSELTEAGSEFIASELNVSPGSKVLDIACGNGRHSIALAKRGFEMTGVDVSGEFLAEASELCLRQNVRVHLLNLDMRRLSFDQPFEGAFCFGNSFGYMDHAETTRFLASLQRALKPGARFILESGIAAESVLPSLQTRHWLRAGDVIVLTEKQVRPRRK